MYAIRAVLLAAAVCAASGARAALVSADDAIFGVGSLTFDSVSLLQWLDLPLSTNRSVNEISAEFGPGGDFEGFRYASRDEVVILWQHAGITTITLGTDAAYSATDAAAVQALVALLGYTAPPGANTFPYARGLTATLTPAGGGNVFSPFVQLCDQIGRRDCLTVTTAKAIAGAALTTTFAAADIGHWLVRETFVPLPPALLLLAGPLALLLRSRIGTAR